MAIKDEIDKILEDRKKKADNLKKKKEDLASLLSSLSALDGLSQKAVDMISDESLREEYKAIFGKIDTQSIRGEIKRLREWINRGIERFGRDYISIATVGRARQGKSRFLQAVGDLDNQIIPAYDTTDCTGATSVIRNDSGMAEGLVSAMITFRQKQDLVNIVSSYIEAIDSSYLLENPIHFDDIGEIRLEKLSEKVEAGNVKQTIPLGHLKKIVENFDEFCDLFGRAPLSLNEPELIKQYVAQNNGKNSEDPDVEYYYKYLAVARADITCRFYADCGRIVLVDTVGLGDTKTGIEESMLNTVDEECDAAIVVTKPISTPQDKDVDLYNLLRDRFAQRDMKKWLFYVVNLHKGNNDNVVSSFANEIKTKQFDVCDCSVIDCSDKEAVNRDFMMPLLQKLVTNMNDIDQAFLDQIYGQWQQVMQKCSRFMDSLPQLSPIDPGQQASLKAFQIGQNTYQRMTAELKKKVLEWREEKDRPNSSLWNRVQEILNKMDNMAPSAQRLQRVIDTNGSMMPYGLWEAALNYTRNEITDQFNSIDDIMDKETITFKNSLVKTMYDALRGIMAENSDKEKHVADGGKEPDMMRWLQNITEEVFNDKPQYKQIYKAFQFLYQFEFNTREHVIQEVRRQLYSINPFAESYTSPEYNFSNTNTGEEVHYYLTSRMAVIEDELRHSLVNLYRTPNQTFYAAAEEFYDRITFAIDIDTQHSKKNDGRFVGMDWVWGNFFMEFNTKVQEENKERYSAVNELITLYNGNLALLNDMIAAFGR